MEERMNWQDVAPDAYKALVGVEIYLARCSLETTLKELVKIRASQLNGCAFCLDMHVTDARKHGESERRLNLLPAWREVSWFTPRERAALAWTEALTLLPQSQAPDADYQALREQFSEKEMVDLTLLISAINAWNRFGVGFRRQPPAL
ncbi:carboxymuconolactone decarboxylase family protein [Cupriavidus necator]|uniref:carboxymuconolactone decarboxylase family protein n=1 Tax=Cupriavidus TaxID=106589 RepID=UPI0014906BC6|nr:carboxymuconolactone decarboxylase family protein [Cupriavidus necator]NOV25764.1 carboxymuconolactone decarboxylase family protein [Cupriavidus necator]